MISMTLRHMFQLFRNTGICFKRVWRDTRPVANEHLFQKVGTVNSDTTNPIGRVQQ